MRVVAPLVVLLLGVGIGQLRDRPVRLDPRRPLEVLIVRVQDHWPPLLSFAEEAGFRI